MKLSDARRRLPVAASLPTPGDRFPRPGAPAGKPTWAIWELTLACDQKCMHCGPRAGQRRRDELTLEECLAVVGELAALGCGEVVLIGGEAYLRSDFVLVIRAIREAGMRCTVVTGGLNLDDARLLAMKEAGLSHLGVSIDGLEATHDHLRGVPGSWRRAFSAIRRARALGLVVSSNCQINRRTCDELAPLLELLAPEGIDAWQLQLTVAHGNAADHPDLILQPYMIPAVFDTLDRLIDRAGQLGVRLWPANSLGYFGPLERRLRAPQRTIWSGCPAGVQSFGIDSDGGVKSCPSLGGPLHVGGNWRERSIREIWDDSYPLSYVRRRTVDDLWGYCRECYYADTCMAGWTAVSEPLLGRPGNNPFCHHRALMLAREGLRERLEHVAPAGGQPFDNGLFRLLREHLAPALRAAHGPVHVDEPRVSRAVEPFGPGRPLGSARSPHSRSSQ